MLDSARQLLRYSIPGWLFLMFLAIFFGVEWLVRWPSVFDDPIIRALTSIDKSSISGLVLFVAAAGIPLGYLIYQVYYFGYWRGLEIGRHQPEDKGMAVLMGINIDMGSWFWYELQLPKSGELNPNGDPQRGFQPQPKVSMI